jgi:hypothetical protein
MKTLSKYLGAGFPLSAAITTSSDMMTGNENLQLGHCPHGYFIQPIDLTERAKINKEYEEMPARLYKIKEVWCLPKEKGQY